MSARTKARKRALDVLYSADVRQQPIAEALSQEASRAVGQPDRRESWVYAAQLVQGVIDHRDEIDEQLSTYAKDWPLERMPAIDRALLRLGVWEILFNPEVPDAVAIAEAVELAGSLSTEDSARFVNGVLGRISATH